MPLTPTDEQLNIISTLQHQPNSLMISAYAGTAKALRTDQWVVTPTGYKEIGNLTEDDLVIGRDGLPHRVTGIYPQGKRSCYSLNFSDGSSVVCTQDHIWTVQRTDDRRLKRTRDVVTTHLINKPRMNSGPAALWGDGTRAYWFFPMCLPVQFPKRSLPIDPYLLGILIGDGNLEEHSVKFSTADQEILSSVRVIVSVDFDSIRVMKISEKSYDYRISSPQNISNNPLLRKLQGLGLAGTKSHTKFIPSDYLMSSVDDRLALLQGLLDTDGYAGGPHAVFTSSSIFLQQEVKFLVESLGGTASSGEFATAGMVAFRLFIKLPVGMQPFRLTRKIKNYKLGQRTPYRALQDIYYAGEAEAVCISVDSADKLFLTNNFIPTHNTTSLQLAAPVIRQPALSLAFNKKIADEIRPKLPPHFETRTLNSLGHRAWSHGRPRLQLDSTKLGKLTTQAFKDLHITASSYQWDATRQLVSAAMLAGISPHDDGAPLTEDTTESWSELTDLSSDDFHFLYPIARTILSESIRLARAGIISFDDQIYCPTILGGTFPKYPVVFVDESQDLSPLNHRMLELTLSSTGRLVAVGDPRQAIYLFRGADATSMSTMRHLRPSWSDCSLTMTFRCPRRVVERQQSHAPGYCAHASVKDGYFAAAFDRPRASGAPQSDNEETEVWWSFRDARLLSNGGTIAILCRNNAPLLSLAFKLLRQSIGCHMLGRDIGRGLQQLSKKLAEDDNTPITTFISKLNDWAESQHSIALANEKPEKAERILDQKESLLAVIEGSNARTAGDLRNALDNLFRRESGQVTLSSIHRAKGLEWDTVIHLDPWRIPAKYALKNPAQLLQEKNLAYVCETRTRNNLLNLNLRDFK